MVINDFTTHAEMPKNFVDAQFVAVLSDFFYYAEEFFSVEKATFVTFSLLSSHDML